MIVYDPFWDTLKQKGISTYTLVHKHEVSSNTLNRLRNNATLKTNTLDRLCDILDCTLQDIMRYVPAVKETQTLCSWFGHGVQQGGLHKCCAASEECWRNQPGAAVPSR